MWSEYPKVAEELQKVEEFIKQNVGSRNRLLTTITQDVLNAGGKRLRPALVILSAHFGSFDSEKAMIAAGALEILHTATLVHDDIIDRSKLRRGKVTVSERYGVDMAVYTGDFLFTKAVLLLSGSLPAERLDLVAKAVKTICEGEVDQFQDRFKVNVSVVEYLKKIRRKTAVLFAAACAMGAIISNCTHDHARSLVKYGLSYGMAFQIRDDLNDLLSTSAQSGKPVGSDIAGGMVTLPVIYALAANHKLRSLLGEYFKPGEALDAARSVEIYRQVIESGGTQRAGTLLDRFINRGLIALKSLPENEYRGILEKMIRDLGKMG